MIVYLFVHICAHMNRTYAASFFACLTWHIVVPIISMTNSLTSCAICVWCVCVHIFLDPHLNAFGGNVVPVCDNDINKAGTIILC